MLGNWPSNYPLPGRVHYSYIYFTCKIYIKPTLLNRYRDSYDELSKSIRTLAEEDEINDSLDEGLRQLSNAVTILGDFMDLQVNRMELKVLISFYSL